MAKLVSKKDGGICDSRNKGIAMATGEIIGFINADDFYASADVLAKVATVFNDLNVDTCAVIFVMWCRTIRRLSCVIGNLLNFTPPPSSGRMVPAASNILPSA